MTIQTFIHTAYSAQNDAGSLANFTDKFTAAHGMMEGKGVDPVAAFLAAVLVENGNNTTDAIEALDFFTGELLRAVQALEKETN